MERRRLVASVLAGSALVGLNLFVLFGRTQTHPGAQAQSGLPPVYVTTIPPSFTTETTVVESVSQAYSTGTARPAPAVQPAGGTSKSKGSAAQTPRSTTPSAVGVGSSSSGTAPVNGVIAVTYAVKGTCSATGATYRCLLTLEASDGLNSAGYLTVYPSLRSGACEAYAPLSNNVANIAGTCSSAYAKTVKAVYSEFPVADAPKLASTSVNWS